MMLLADVDRIREERIKKNLSCRKLSLLADLPDNALSRIEARECKTVHPLRAAAIAKALRCLAELLGYFFDANVTLTWRYIMIMTETW